MLKTNQDAYGQMMYDYFKGRDAYEVVEREDGFFGFSRGPELYHLEYKKWPIYEKQAIKHARGRVLDIGCGAGRHSLYLQNKGFDVVGIDNSPLVIKVCKEKGLRDARLMPITRLGHKTGIFDTILMFGNNFALLGNRKRAVRLLRRFHKMTSENARIIAQSRDPYCTDDPDHRQYHARNRRQGKLGGEARIRVRYKRYVTPWFDFLLVSQKEMKAILKVSGWRIGKILEGQGGIYIAIIEKVS